MKTYVCSVCGYSHTGDQAPEGYPEVAEAYKRIAFEKAEHACKFVEL